MADDAERVDPKGTLETVPPPRGAKDAYSAETRVGTLPEHVLAAMREQETDAALAARTRSGTRAAVRPLAPPPLPSFPAAPPPLPPRSSSPRSSSPPAPPSGLPAVPWSRLPTPRPSRAPAPPLPRASLPPPSPLAPLALTPHDAWLSGPPPHDDGSFAQTPYPPEVPFPPARASAPPPFPPSPPSASTPFPPPPSSAPQVQASWLPDAPASPRLSAFPRLSFPPSFARLTPLPPATRDLVRSVAIVAMFAFLGALVAVAITLAGY